MKDFDKHVDLHESEWQKDGKHEPVFGPGAAWFLQVILPTAAVTIAVGYGAKFIIYGLFG
jgi:hypothetical protein